MWRRACNGNGNGYGQPHPTTNYHRTHSGEHVTKVVAQKPCHAGGGAVQHHVVHKQSFKEVDGAKAPACFDNYPMNHHGGGGSSHHRYEVDKTTYQETSEKETSYYAYGAGGRHIEYNVHEVTYDYEEEEDDDEEEEEEEEQVVGGGGCAQLRRPCRRA